MSSTSRSATSLQRWSGLACIVALFGCADEPGNSAQPTPAAAPATPASASIEEVVKSTAPKSLRSMGMKRYKRGKAIAEMKKQLGDVARAAAMAYEHSSSGDGKGVAGVLCSSATPVPATMPSWETPYVPKKEEGTDFQTGDDKSGWKCLRHSPKTAMSFQLTYSQGIKYKSVERGGEDPGPKGFEVAAEFDSDGNGRTALLAMTGKVGADGKLTLSKQVFEADVKE